MAEIAVDADEVVAKFIAAWNADYEADARRLLEASCNEQTHFVSTTAEYWGLSSQLRAIGEFRRQYPKGRCSARVLSQHHRWVLVSWKFDFGDGQTPLTGVDAGQFDAAGRLIQMVSFAPVSVP
jgi:hypothetical protein